VLIPSALQVLPRAGVSAALATVIGEIARVVTNATTKPLRIVFIFIDIPFLDMVTIR